MTERTAAEIKAYCEAASDGPWVTADEGAHWPILKERAPEKQPPYYDDVLIGLDEQNAAAKASATFCINARTDLPLLLEATWNLYGMIAHLYHEGATVVLDADGVAECERMIDEYARYGTDASGVCDFRRLGEDTDGGS